MQVFHCSECSLEMVKELAVLLQLGPCGSSDRFPHGHTFPNHVFRYSAPDKRSMQHVTHLNYRSLPSQTASTASAFSTSPVLVEGDLPLG